MYTREQIETAVKAKGYKWFEDKNNKGYDVNIEVFGILQLALKLQIDSMIILLFHIK